MSVNNEPKPSASSHTSPLPYNVASGWNFSFNIEWGRARGLGIFLRTSDLREVLFPTLLSPICSFVVCNTQKIIIALMLKKIIPSNFIAFQ